MTEKILLLPGGNGTELLRTLARFYKNSLGLRIMNPAEFARFALMRCGKIPTENFLPRKQEAAVIDSFVSTISYFDSASYADSEKIADALFRLRSLIPEEEESQLHKLLPLGEFPEKNDGLLEVYDRYQAVLKSNGHLDTIGLIRKALAEALPLFCPVYTLAEYPLSPLEEALVRRLAGERIHTLLPQLFGAAGRTPASIDYTKSYGSVNEVAAIYDYILSHNLPLDTCTVAIAETGEYAQLFYDFAQSHGLNIALGCGVPILNANPARLLKLLNHWNTAGYHGVDALRALLRSDAMDQKKLLDVLGINAHDLEKVISIAGQLRLSRDVEENNRRLAALPLTQTDEPLRPCLTVLAGELALRESQFLEKYARIRTESIGRVDRSALSVICDTLDAYTKYTGGTPELIIPEILQRSVCSENSREGALFVTGISGSLTSLRKHLFIAGMSAAHFPGTPRENYLLLDRDYLLFAEEGIAPTSDNLIQRKKDTLDHLLNLAGALDVNVHISYSGYDLADLKAENPSSALFDVFKKQQGESASYDDFKSAFRAVGYFDSRVTGDHTVGRAYVEENTLLPQAPVFSQPPCAHEKKESFSPSAIDLFFQCPRRFFLTRILGVREEQEDDPFSVIDGAAVGNLAHALMEELSHSPCHRDAFLARAAAAFDHFLLSRPPLHPDSAAAEKKVFCKMMANAYDSNPNNEVISAEEKQEATCHSSGISLHGIPDRVEKTETGEYIIVDYKTKRKIEHIPNDINTCLQVVIYAYLMQQRGIPISRCEYRYLRYDQVIPCRYDAEMEQALDAKLQAFKNALDSGIFPADAVDCKYCTLGSICGKKEEKEEAK